jgi:molybdopterin-guanine dinucleotide biosynthesis protein A
MSAPGRPRALIPEPFKGEGTPVNGVTGVVLAGGRGERLGGVDKGLQLLAGRPAVQHAIDRLAPQVGTLGLSANRNLAAYAAFGLPVWADHSAGHEGPLAGIHAALAACATPWLVAVPCDVPGFPRDLVARLAAAAEGGAGAVVASQPVFMLLSRAQLSALEHFLAHGGRSAWRFAAEAGLRAVRFDDPAAFAGANTPDEWAALERTWTPA